MLTSFDPGMRAAAVAAYRYGARVSSLALMTEDPEEEVGAVGQAEEGCEGLPEGNPTTEAAASQDQTDHPLAMTPRELEDRSAPR
jgi:hypothetical protein